jgi:hypothetical protein
MTKSKSASVKSKAGKKLSPEAVRALAEALERRAAAAKNPVERPVEIRGRKGPEPVRYGDWEKNGIVSDF